MTGLSRRGKRSRGSFVPLLEALGLGTPVVRRRLLAREAWASVGAKPLRTLLTASATMLGIGLLVLTVALSATAERRVAAGFDALRATQVLVRPAGPTAASVGPVDLARLAALEGVEAAGVIVRQQPVEVRKADAPWAPVAQAELVAASPGGLAAVEVEFSRGHGFADWHARERIRVALVGRNVAERLGGLVVDGRSVIRIDGRSYVVAGITGSTPRRPTLVDAVVVPTDRAGPATDGVIDIVVRTAPGAAGIVAEQAPLALSPHAPERWRASAPPDPDTLRAGIEAGVRNSLLGVAVAVMLVASLSIANATFVSVLERTRQIGVRRAVGATPAHIRLQVLLEAALLGLLGGAAGTSLATVALVAIASLQQTTPVLPPAMLVVAPVLGTAIGLLAGALPARRASRIEPVEAMRTG